MRREAATIALAMICSSLLCTGTLLAKPTRTFTRPSARRTIIYQPLHRPSPERSSQDYGRPRARLHESARETRSHRPALTHDASMAAMPQPGRGRLTRSIAARPVYRASTLSRQRAQAAQKAVAAADRNPQIALTTQNRRIHADKFIEATVDTNPAALSDTFDPGSAAPGSAIASTEVGDNSTASLANTGGVLRPAAGTLPLKSIEEEATHPVLLPTLRLSSLYDSEGRLIMPRPLYGSRDILLHQNEMADRDGLNRIQDDADVLDLRRQKKLVALPESEALHADFRLPEDRRYTRPWTAAFLTVFAADFYATFHLPLQVDSAVRTIAVQQHLLRTNGNAAPTSGDTASPHLTGQAVDIAKGGLTRTQIAWMRTYLQPLIDLGKIDVEEEFQQSCFHISVYRNFPATAPAHVSVAATRQPVAGAIAETPSY